MISLIRVLGRKTSQSLWWSFLFLALLTYFFVPVSQAAPNDLILSLLSSSEADVSGNPNNVLIGEVLTYQLVYEVAQGTNTNVVITAILPNGLEYVPTASSSVSNDAGWTAPMVVGGGGASGADVTFSFGTINNTDSDVNAETITIQFKAIVNNIAANQSGTNLSVNSQLSINAVLTTSSSNVTVTIIEPNISMTSYTIINPVGLIATANPSTDAGDTFDYYISFTNSGNAPAYDLTLRIDFPLGYVAETTGVYSTSGTSCFADTITGFNPVYLTFPCLNVGETANVRVNVTVRNTVEPRDSWSSSASLTDYSSLPDENGTNNDVPGAYGASNGARNGADGNGGALNDYATSSINSPTLTVAIPTAAKQVEHPLNTPVASTLFPTGYSDSTNDANTGSSLHETAEPSDNSEPDVDITIGETFDYIITVTFPEGTTDGLFIIDISYPTALSNGRQWRFIEIFNAELIHVGANLSGVGVPALGSTYTATDSNADGDTDTITIQGTGARTVLNTPDNVTDDNDRLVFRVSARLDDEDASGGAADDLVGVDNNNSEYAGNRVQIAWTDNVGPRNFSIVEDIDIVEPVLTLTKTASVAVAGQGDTVAFTLTLTNTGTAPAYDVAFTDTLPFLGATNYFTFSSINAASSTCDERTGYSATTGSPVSSFDFDNLLVGENCTLVINATVQNTTTVNTTYTNNASITNYSSRPGAATDERSYGPVNASANVQVIDRVTVAFDTASSSAAEATGVGNVLRITTASGNPTSAAATVTIARTGGTAAVADYSVTGTVTIPVGTANNSLVSIASGFTVTNETTVEPDETVNLQISAPSSNAVLGAQTTHTHTIQNDDSTTLTINDNSITEGNSGTVTLNLTVTNSVAVQGGFTVAYSLSDGTATIADNDYAATGSSLNFTGTAGQTRTISITINGDLNIEANETFTASLGAISGTTIASASFVRVDTGTGTINNDDSAGITVSPTTIAIAEGGATASFNVSAQANPTSSVSIPVTTDGECTVSVNPIVLAAGGTTPVSVTVTAVDDLDIEGAHTCTITLGDPGSADTNFDALTAANTADVTANVADNDFAGITVNPTTIAITEGGATASFDVSAQANPTSPVSIPVTTDGECTVSVNPIVLAAGGTTPVSVTVTAVDDLDIEGAHTCAITLGDPGSADTNFDALTAANTADVTANVADNDFAGITVNPTTIAITEGGVTASFDISSNSNTSATVDIPIVTDGQCLLSTTASPVPANSLNVTLPVGSGTAITVTVEALNDNFAEGAHSCAITTGDPSSADTNYNALSAVDVADVTANITDNDTAGISLAALTITEGAAGLDMDVVLGSEPTGDVTITLASDAQCTLSSTTLTFTDSAGASPWNIAQPITVTAVDDNFAEGAHLCVISYSSTSTDPNYTVAATNHNVDVVDNDTARISLAALTITEGPAGLDMDVVLGSEPTGDVTITLASDAQCTLSSTTLTFTGAAGVSPWNVVQPITVTAVDDNFAEGAHLCVITYSATSTDLNYTVASTNHNVDVVDNDTAGISLAALTITEGAAGLDMDVVLGSEPTGDVTITLASDAQCTLSSTTLTFTGSAGASPWNIAQPITVTAVDDAFSEGAHVCVITYSATSTDLNYMVAATNHNVDVVDNDTPGVLLIQTGGNTRISENGNADRINISLATEPIADVTITLSTNAQCTISPTTLSFTDSAGASPWNIAQRVTITAIDDSDIEGAHVCQISYTSNSADTNYNLLTDNLRVHVGDNDDGDTATVGVVGVEPEIGVFDPAISKLGLLVPGELGVTGERLEWIVTVTNSGSAAGTNVVVSDTLRSELSIIRVEFITGSGTSQITGQTVTVTIPTLATGQSVVFKIVTDVIAGASVDNTACVSAANLTPERCVTALPVQSLPATGETGLWWLWFTVAGAFALLVVAGFWGKWMRRRA